MISYSTNWMGPIGMWWFRDNGFTETTTVVASEDNELTGAKRGDVIERETITEYWYGGRIDICGTDSPFGEEMSLPIMDGPSYASFSDWLEQFETDSVWTLDQLVREFERTHNQIRWFEDEQKNL